MLWLALVIVVVWSELCSILYKFRYWGAVLAAVRKSEIFDYGKRTVERLTTAKE